MIASSAAPLDRLHDSRDIASVFRGGRQRAGRLVVLHALQRPSVDLDTPDVDVTDGNTRPANPGAVAGPAAVGPARLTVTASRKVGTAVARNRAKRLLREAARRVAWAPGHDLVLVARRSCASSTMPAVLDELRELAEALHVTRDPA